MMPVDTPEKDKKTETASKMQKKDHEQPSLSADFFAELLKQPLCKRTGECDNCGQCQH